MTQAGGSQPADGETRAELTLEDAAECDVTADKEYHHLGIERERKEPHH